MIKFRDRTLRQLANMIIGDVENFPRRSSSYITEFFEECDTDYAHDGSTRWALTPDTLREILAARIPGAHTVPPVVSAVMARLMEQGEAQQGDPGRTKALSMLNEALGREGFEAFYAEDGRCNWLGEQLDASQRSQIMFIQRSDILDLFIVHRLPVPAGALPSSSALDDNIPF